MKDRYTVGSLTGYPIELPVRQGGTHRRAQVEWYVHDLAYGGVVVASFRNRVRPAVAEAAARARARVLNDIWHSRHGRSR